MKAFTLLTFITFVNLCQRSVNHYYLTTKDSQGVNSTFTAQHDNSMVPF